MNKGEWEAINLYTAVATPFLQSNCFQSPRFVAAKDSLLAILWAEKKGGSGAVPRGRITLPMLIVDVENEAKLF